MSSNIYNYNSYHNGDDCCLGISSPGNPPSIKQECCNDPKYQEKCCYGFLPDLNNNPSCELIGGNSCETPEIKTLCKKQNCSTGKNRCQLELNQFIKNSKPDGKPDRKPDGKPDGKPSPKPGVKPGPKPSPPKKFWNTAGGIITIIGICLAIALSLIGLTYLLTKRKHKKNYIII